MTDATAAPFNQRLGYHYFPDTDHYRQRELEVWLPELHRLGAAWLTLLAPTGRAIPEPFISGLLNASIQPVLHFILPPGQPQRSMDWQLLLEQYARWGVRYIAFYDRPNTRQVWDAAAWTHGDLVERFVDGFLPLAEAALAQGLSPVFPPLEPGGDYWDLAFLRLALRSLQRRGQAGLLDALALGVYAWIDERPIDWGAGGPQRWSGARPYTTLAGVEDQRGFRIFDWYLAIAEQEVGHRLPVLGLRAGQKRASSAGPEKLLAHARHNLAAARLLAARPDAVGMLGVEAGGLMIDPLPPEILACNFWLLAAAPGSPDAEHAWYPCGGEPLPVAQAFAQWVAYHRRTSPPTDGGVDAPGWLPPASQEAENTALQAALPGREVLSRDLETASAPIDHYILLPLYAWGAASWDLTLIQPLLDETHPTVGFSLAEARLARRVTVVGGSGAVSDAALEMLRHSGCKVQRMREDGTLVAT